jgi:hypothetical protein
MCGKVIIFIIFLIPVAQARTFHSIHGVVTDAKSGYPIENVNVFLAYTMMGAATDKDGYFSIPKVPAGTFDLVVSHVNYRVQSRSIRVEKLAGQLFRFKLIPQIHEISPIIINAEANERWQENFSKFREILIGKTANAQKTKILNPLVVSFSEDESGNLLAESSAPLMIENSALGYNLEYLLMSFIAADDYIKYSGIPKFEEAKPGSSFQKKGWSEKRRAAYLGSFRHFLKTICDYYRQSKGKISRGKFVIDTTGGEQKLNIYHNGNIDSSEFELDNTDVTENGIRISLKDESYIKRQGFDVWYLSNLWLVYPRPVTLPAKTNNYLHMADLPTEMYLKFPNSLRIRYTDPSSIDSHYRQSYITLEKDSVLIDIYGRYHESLMIRMSGYWANQRLADMLPYEYNPDR